MTLLLVALLAVVAASTVIVLADSGLRMRSAFAGMRAQQAMLCDASRLPEIRAPRVTTRVSHARPVARAVCAPPRAAA
jgi:hypothetical protein